MYFIRHGQSEFNVHFNVTGRDPNIPDSPLSAKGRNQVQAAAERLVGCGITKIISSPYTRALQTASILAEAISAPILIDPSVGERRLYSCDIGSPACMLKKNFPHVEFNGFDSDSWWLPFDETHRDLMKRVTMFQSEWASEPSSDSSLVVSHYYFIQAITGRSLDNAEVVKAG